MLSLAVLVTLVCFSNAHPVKNDYVLSVIHFNDFHARFEETNQMSGVCKMNDTCIGGFSRLYETSMKLLKERPNALLLNAGDNYEGTLWYTVHKWNATQYFLNKLPTDATTIGNHEFDDKVQGLVPFLQHFQTPIVVANIDASEEPSLQGLFSKSVIVTKNGRKIGIIGVLLSQTKELTDTGKVKFLDESTSINQEAERLVKEEGVFTNIVLSHCGYDLEKELAKNSTGKISLIVGGHSHSFLYSGDSPPGPDVAEGPYPTLIGNKFGEKVLVVQASSYTKYLGNLTVYYNDDGNVTGWSGAPIYLGNDIPKNDYIDKELLPWKAVVDKEGEKIIGETLVKLENKKCRYLECEFGNLVTAAMFKANQHVSNDTYVTPAFIHGGGIRAGLEIGNITYNDLASVFPFGSTIDSATINGGDLLTVLEACADVENLYYVQLDQVYGMKLSYNLSEPIGKRLTSAKIKRKNETVYDDLDTSQTYSIILPSFLATSNFFKFKQFITDRQIGNVDIDVISNYIGTHSPLNPKIEGRIIVIQ